MVARPGGRPCSGRHHRDDTIPCSADAGRLTGPIRVGSAPEEAQDPVPGVADIHVSAVIVARPGRGLRGVPWAPLMWAVIGVGGTWPAPNSSSGHRVRCYRSEHQDHRHAGLPRSQKPPARVSAWLPVGTVVLGAGFLDFLRPRFAGVGPCADGPGRPREANRRAGTSGC